MTEVDLPPQHEAEDASVSQDEAEKDREESEDEAVLVEGRPKKRRRTAKPNPDKKYECTHEGCGKSYSRAEHLYRHQLNRQYLFACFHCRY